MSATSYFWHDYETFGIDPQRDRACQFAGIRTDLDFNVIGEPLMLYCKLADDYLPNPEACLITGITPQQANQKGLCEAEFIGRIEQQMAQPQTCSLGYNSLRFDDEVTRNLLYRNFFDPYAREWQNGNSRWDMIDVARAARALRPNGIVWPNNEDGSPCFRLEDITKANGIAHHAAHDALSDVYATIALARLIRQKQPKLYDYLSEHRHKTAVTQQLQLGSFKPVVHVSGRYPARKNCLAVVLPICAHPINSNEVIVYDLSVEPSTLLELNAEQIRQRLFVATEDLAEGVERIPLKTIHINKSPVLAPLSVIRPGDAERLNLDIDQCRNHAEQIQAFPFPVLEKKLAEVFSRSYDNSVNDPDLMIYSGGFFSRKDKAAMQKIRNSSPQQLADLKLNFEDDRLAEMLFRYRGRNFPETLTAQEGENWLQFCRQRLNPPTFDSYSESLTALRNEQTKHDKLLSELQAYAVNQRQFLNV